MKCDNCPAMWAERDIMTACGVEHGEYGCLIKGRGRGARTILAPLRKQKSGAV